MPTNKKIILKKTELIDLISETVIGATTQQLITEQDTSTLTVKERMIYIGYLSRIMDTSTIMELIGINPSNIVTLLPPVEGDGENDVSSQYNFQFWK